MCRVELTQVEVNMLMFYKKLIFFYIFLSCEVILKYIKSTRQKWFCYLSPCAEIIAPRFSLTRVTQESGVACDLS